MDLESQPAEITFTLEITRAATGEIEVVELVGHVVNPPEIEGDPQ